MNQNHCVPNFDTNHHPKPSSHPQFVNMQEDEVMELLWQDGQLITQTPTKIRSFVSNGLPSLGSKEAIAAPVAAPANQFIQDDEMASWLHYSLDDELQFDRDFCSDILFPATAATADGSCTDTAVTDLVQLNRPPPTLKPPVAPTRGAGEDFQSHGFGHFLRFKGRQGALESVPLVSETVVESNAIPVKEAVRVGLMAGSSSVGVETTSLDFTVESSSGASGAEPGIKLSACGDKKRKDCEPDQIECHSQDVATKATDTKKQVPGSTTKRTRAAEVHNLSERRRRDRINEKMKTLQDLIPRCNKSDKASMLDDAIEYLKSLQMQLQMMSMGCGFVPMMFPGMQQFMSPMAMGMGMGIDVNRPMMPFPMTTPAHMGPRFPMPSYHPIPPFLPPDSTRIQADNQGSMLNPTGLQNTYQQQAQTLPDLYQQYPESQIMQMKPPRNNVTTLLKTTEPTPRGGPENLEPRPPPG